MTNYFERATGLGSLMEGEVLPNGNIVLGVSKFDESESFVLCLTGRRGERFEVCSVDEHLDVSGCQIFESFHDAFRGFAKATGSDPESFANWR